MSYVNLNGMRSTRYPLSGCGCGCGACGDSGDGLSSVFPDDKPWALPVTLLGVGALAYYMSKKRVRPNRRHRRR